MQYYVQCVPIINVTFILMPHMTATNDYEINVHASL